MVEQSKIKLICHNEEPHIKFDACICMHMPEYGCICISRRIDESICMGMHMHACECMQMHAHVLKFDKWNEYLKCG